MSDCQQMEFFPKLSQEASHVRTSALPPPKLGVIQGVKELMVRDRGYGRNAPELLGIFSQDSPSLKTSQTCLTERGVIGLSEYSGTFPRSGMMRSGTVFQLPMLASPISEIASGLLPTPTRRDFRDFSNPTPSQYRSLTTRDSPSAALIATTTWGYRVSPKIYEWMMGYPIGHTELNH